jgi:polar amino acid transport system substrate-binding protein
MGDSRNATRHAAWHTWFALIVGAGLALFPGVPEATAATLDRIKQNSKLVLGYREDAQPFSFKEQSGEPSGYSIALCQKVAEEIKTELGIADLAVEWVPVSLDDRFAAVEQGKVDLLCGADTVTLERRKQVSFSIPAFPSGIAAMVRADSPRALQDVLTGKPPSGPLWRASPAQILTDKKFSVVERTTAEKWLSSRLNEFQLTATVVPVASYDAGVQGLLDGNADVFFGDLPIVVNTIAASPSSADLLVLDRQFTSEPIALALARNDDDFRLVIDRALSRFFPTKEFRDLYGKWFGAPDETVVNFFRQSALPD